MLAAFDAACCAANGVPLRDPRNPSEPELFQLSVLPIWSVIVTMVLLNEAWMCATPNGTFLRSRFLNFLLLLPALPVAAFCSGFAIRSSPLLSSCLQLCPYGVPCGCGRWCGYAGRAPAATGDGGCRDSFGCR